MESHTEDTWVKVTMYTLPLKSQGEQDYYGEKNILQYYELPRSVYQNRTWVIRWRLAWWQLRFKKITVHLIHSYYKRSELYLTEEEKLKRQIIQKKGYITKCKNAIAEHCKYMRQIELFYDEGIDSDLKKAKKKQEIAELQLAQLEKQYQQYQVNTNPSI